MAAMVAYNLMLSVFPFALLLLFITGQLLQSPDVQATILSDLGELFPSTEQDTLRSTLDQLRSNSTEIGIVAIVAGLWIGASFWGAMDTAFCRIYHVECRGWLAQKRFALIMLAVVAFFLAASVAVPAIESLLVSGVEDLPLGLVAGRLAAQRDRHRRRPADQLPDPLPDLLGGAEGPPAVARGLARRPVHGDRRRHRQHDLPALPGQHLDRRRVRPDRQLRPRRPDLVLRAGARPARRSGHQRAPLRAPRHRDAARDDRRLPGPASAPRTTSPSTTGSPERRSRRRLRRARSTASPSPTSSGVGSTSKSSMPLRSVDDGLGRQPLDERLGDARRRPASRARSSASSGSARAAARRSAAAGAGPGRGRRRRAGRRRSSPRARRSRSRGRPTPGTSSAAAR